MDFLALRCCQIIQNNVFEATLCVTTSEMGCSDTCNYLAVKGFEGARGMKSCSRGTQMSLQNLSAGASLWLCDTSLPILCISCKVFAQVSLQLKQRGGLHP